MKAYNLLLLLIIAIFTSCQEEITISFMDKTEEVTISQSFPYKINKTELDRIAKCYGCNLSRGEAYNLSSILDENGDTTMIIMNFLGEKGWVLVSNSKNYYPVLAYSEMGSFKVSLDMAPAYKKWEKECIYAIRHSNELPTDTIDKIKMMWKRFEKSLDEKEDKANSRYQNITHAEYLSLQQAKRQFQINLGLYYDEVEIYGTNDFVRLLGADVAEEALSLAQGATHPLYEDIWEDFTFLIWTSKDTGPKVNHLINSTWHQSGEYAQSFRDVTYQGFTNRLAGSGPVALGQVMRYYQYPSSFFWDNMPLDTPTTETSDFLKEVADSMDCIYTYWGALASPQKMLNAITKFGYSRNMYNNDSHVMSNLATGKPIIIYADNCNAGNHEIGADFFILDGYRSYNTYSSYRLCYAVGVEEFTESIEYQYRLYSDIFWGINWCFTNTPNGYYRPNNLSVDGADFNSDRKYICEIAPISH